jgi:hypothetical protein
MDTLTAARVELAQPSPSVRHDFQTSLQVQVGETKMTSHAFIDKNIIESVPSVEFQEMTLYYAATKLKASSVDHCNAVRVQNLIRQGEAALIALYKLTSHERGKQPSKATIQVRQRPAMLNSLQTLSQLLNKTTHNEIR